ncbi:hypothetical protein RF11_08997 [Thelohanellus kitauei]|uniref:Uncharacterized protein n=1 Tax=Thelohanellus kitauei TaxID=669202 RepID=A0A0C2M705_THEKT|nr:hypothetical protein RF11_08997 [Thelohanellus kitauei]
MSGEILFEAQPAELADALRDGQEHSVAVELPKSSSPENLMAGNLKLKYGKDPKLTIALHHRRDSVKPVNAFVTHPENHEPSNPCETSLRLSIETFRDLSHEMHYFQSIRKPKALLTQRF